LSETAAIRPNHLIDTHDRLRRTLGLIVLVVVLKPISNVFMTWGVRQFPHVLSYQPLAYVQALFNPLVVIAVMMQVFWLLTRMSLLSRADLSFVLPVTSTGYAISAFLGRFFLHEQLTPNKFTGILMITAGALLVTPTAHVQTVPEPATHEDARLSGGEGLDPELEGAGPASLRYKHSESA
jgi:uncharacterized membrane protein